METVLECSWRFLEFLTHSPYLLRIVANIQVLLDCRYALFVFNLILNFKFCDGCCSSFKSSWFLYLVILIQFISLDTVVVFQSQGNSIGYRCWTALFSSDFPHLILAARTILSFPLKSSVTNPNLHKFMFRFSPLMITISSIAKAGRFSFLYLMLCLSGNDFKYSLFHLFHALSLHFLTYFALFRRSPYNMLMSSSKLNVFSPNAKVFGVKIGNCISSFK